MCKISGPQLKNCNLSIADKHTRIKATRDETLRLVYHSNFSTDLTVAFFINLGYLIVAHTIYTRETALDKKREEENKIDNAH